MKYLRRKWIEEMEGNPWPNHEKQHHLEIGQKRCQGDWESDEIGEPGECSIEKDKRRVSQKEVNSQQVEWS